MSELTAVADAIRAADRFLLVSHENPDGDAFGSILAMKLGLDALGKDSVMYIGGEMTFPLEYAFLGLDDIGRGLPLDAGDRVILAVDSATAPRTRVPPEVLEAAPLVIDVDHHHDNTRYGGINLIVPDASSTAEIVRDLLRELGVELTLAMAVAIYVGLYTDTGKFSYSNTTQKAHGLAKELLGLGVLPQEMFGHIYESELYERKKLQGKALERMTRYEDGRMVVTYLLREDFEELGVGEEYAEGVIDQIRNIKGVEFAMVIREPPVPDGPARRVSMRSTTDAFDVSTVARQRGGGGHRRAAGFSTDETVEEIIEFARREFARATESVTA